MTLDDAVEQASLDLSATAGWDSQAAKCVSLKAAYDLLSALKPLAPFWTQPFIRALHGAISKARRGLGCRERGL